MIWYIYIMKQLSPWNLLTHLSPDITFFLLCVWEYLGFVSKFPVYNINDYSHYYAVLVLRTYS